MKVKKEKKGKKEKKKRKRKGKERKKRKGKGKKKREIHIIYFVKYISGLPDDASGEEPACQCRRCSIPGLGRSPGGRQGNPLQ